MDQQLPPENVAFGALWDAAALGLSVLLQSVCAMYIEKSVAMSVLPSLAFEKTAIFLS